MFLWWLRCAVVIVGSGVGSGGSVHGAFGYCILRKASIVQRKQQHQQKKIHIKAAGFTLLSIVRSRSNKRAKDKSNFNLL